MACFLTLRSPEKDRLMTSATIISRLCTIAPTHYTAVHSRLCSPVANGLLRASARIIER